MKLSTASIFASLSLAVLFPLSAQVAAPAAAVPVVTDGIVFYNGLPYVLRNGRAFLIDATLVPQGQILTHDGKLVPLPSTFTAFPAPAPKTETGSQTERGIVPILPPNEPPPVRKGTDQQVLINPPRAAAKGKVTGTGAVPRK